jgi:hypothetical protein
MRAYYIVVWFMSDRLNDQVALLLGFQKKDGRIYIYILYDIHILIET